MFSSSNIVNSIISLIHVRIEMINKFEKNITGVSKILISFERYSVFQNIKAQSAGAVKYTDYISAEGQDPHPTPLHNECPGYDIKQYDGSSIPELSHKTKSLVVS